MALRKASGLSHSCSFADIYIDDSFGLTCLSPDEPLLGSSKGPNNVDMLLTIRKGGHVSVMLRLNVSRAQMHMEIACDTFNEAGWDTAEDKKQLGFHLDLLGFSISSANEGCIHVPEAKRLGMLSDLEKLMHPSSNDGSVEREQIETLVGRVSHLAMVASEGNAYLKPMFAMANARRQGTRKSARRDNVWSFGKCLYKPRRLHIKGRTKAQSSFQMCLRWWKAAFEIGFSVPLAHKRSFPLPGEPGCAFIFTDAAREAGSGYGGFSIISVLDDSHNIHHLMPFLSEVWDPDVCERLQRDDISMAAGEAFGAIALMDAMCDSLPDLSHMVIFSDSMATVQLINSNNSSSPQMDFIFRWFVERRPSLFMMALHISGMFNSTSDAFSRGNGDHFLAEASAAGCTPRRLQPAHECCSMLHDVIFQDQRGLVIL